MDGVTTTILIENDDTVDGATITEGETTNDAIMLKDFEHQDVTRGVTTKNATVQEDLEHHTPFRQTPLLYIPDNNYSSSKNIHKVTSLTPPSSHVMDTCIGYHLPVRHDRGKPSARYSPSTKGKCIISLIM